MENLKKLGRELAILVALRLGTASAVWLVAQGIPQSSAGQVEALAVVLAGLLYDRLMAYFIGKETKQDVRSADNSGTELGGGAARVEQPSEHALENHVKKSINVDHGQQTGPRSIGEDG